MRRFGAVLKAGGLLLGIAVIGGWLYAQSGRFADAKLAPPEREMVTVDGRRVHVVSSGDGPRTFVLDAGLGGWSLFWGPIQGGLARNGRVYSFDRAGTGWSEASAGAHDGAAAAAELAAIVRAARIPTPFVYVGHSLGANFAQIYAQRHPEDVSALVLLEPGQPRDLLEDFHGTRQQAMAAGEHGAAWYLARLCSAIGVTRLGGQLAPGRSFSGIAKAQYRAGLSRPTLAPTIVATVAALPRTAYEDMDVASFGDTPVLVLNSSEPREPEGKESVADVRAWRTGYLSYLASLARKSTHGVGPIEIPSSSHKSMVLGGEQAATVVREIVAFLGGDSLR